MSEMPNQDACLDQAGKDMDSLNVNHKTDRVAIENKLEEMLVEAGVLNYQTPGMHKIMPSLLSGDWEESTEDLGIDFSELEANLPPKAQMLIDAYRQIMTINQGQKSEMQEETTQELIKCMTDNQPEK